MVARGHASNAIIEKYNKDIKTGQLNGKLRWRREICDLINIVEKNHKNVLKKAQNPVVGNTLKMATKMLFFKKKN